MKENIRLNTIKNTHQPQPKIQTQYNQYNSLMPQLGLNALSQPILVQKTNPRTTYSIKHLHNNKNSDTLADFKSTLPAIRTKQLKATNSIDSESDCYIYVKNLHVVRDTISHGRSLNDETHERVINWVEEHGIYFQIFKDYIVRIDRCNLTSYMLDNKRSVTHIIDAIEYESDGKWLSAKPVLTIWVNRKVKIIQKALKDRVSSRKLDKYTQAALVITRFIRKAAYGLKHTSNKRHNISSLKALFIKLQNTCSANDGSSAIRIFIANSYSTLNETSELVNLYKIFELINPRTTIVYITTSTINTDLEEYYKTLARVLKINDIDKRLIILSLSSELRLLSADIDPCLKILCCNKTLSFLRAVKTLNPHVEIQSSTPITKYAMQLAVDLNMPFERNVTFVPSMLHRIEKSFETTPLILHGIKSDTGESTKLKTGLSLHLDQTIIKGTVKQADTVTHIHANDAMFRSLDGQIKPHKVNLVLPALINKGHSAINCVKNNRLNKKCSQNVIKNQIKVKFPPIEICKSDAKHMSNPGGIFKTEILSWNGQKARSNDFSIDVQAFSAKPLKGCKDIRDHLSKFMDNSVFEPNNEFQLVFINPLLAITVRLASKANQAQNSSETILPGVNDYCISFEATESIKTIDDINKLLKKYSAILAIKKYGQYRFEELGFIVSAGVNIEISDPVVVRRAGGLVSVSSVDRPSAQQHKSKWIIQRAIQLSGFYNEINNKSEFVVIFTQINKNDQIIDIIPNIAHKSLGPFDLLTTTGISDLILRNNKFIIINKLPMQFFKKSKFEHLFGFLKLEGFSYNFNTNEGLLALPCHLPNNRHTFDLVLVYKNITQPAETLEKLIGYIKAQKNPLDKDILSSLTKIFRPAVRKTLIN